MPIQILIPPTDGPIGIGLATSTLVDTALWEPGDALIVTIQGGPVENSSVIGGGRSPANQSIATQVTLGNFISSTANQWVAHPQRADAVHGQPVRVIWDHVSSSLISKEQKITSQIYDQLTGLSWALPKLQAAAQGGFTEEDRTDLKEVRKATFTAFPPGAVIGAVANFALGALIDCPPASNLVPVDTLLLTGDGTVDRPSGPTGVDAYGFTFRFEVVPPGLSVIDGVSLTYPERMAQFLVIKVDSAGNEFVSDRYEFHNDQERVCWGTPFPRRIAYSVLPGVSMRFSWLLMRV